MKKIALAYLLAMELSTIGIALAQEVEPEPAESCPGSPREDCDRVCSFDWRPYYEQGVRVMNRKVGQDFMSVRLDDFPIADEGNLIFGVLRETWYVRREGLEGQSGPLYRCVNSLLLDSRDSVSTSEGAPAYNCFVGSSPNILANPWLASAQSGRKPTEVASSGLLPLRRYRKTGGTDYRTWTASVPAGFTLDTLLGSPSATRYGYQRFGKLLKKDQVLGAGESSGYGTYSLNNGTLWVDLNSTWGNAIGKIRHIPSGQQIVSEPIGDMVQSVIRFDSGDPDCWVPNPTQSGGAQCVSPDYSRTSRWAGSPMISVTRNGTSQNAPQTFISVIRPLDFCHNGRNRMSSGEGEGEPAADVGTPAWAGATETDPLLWNGFIERTETLACRLGSNATLRKEVLRSTSRYQLADIHGGLVTKVSVLNTYWLKASALVSGTQPTMEWDLKIYCKDLERNTVRQLLATPSGKTKVNPKSEESDGGTCGVAPGTPRQDISSQRARHAIIAARSDGSFVYAVARMNVPPGGYTNVTLRCAAGPGCTNPEKGTVIIQAHTLLVPLSKTAWSSPQESFLIVGNKGAVMDAPSNRLAELNAEAMTVAGVNCGS